MPEVILRGKTGVPQTKQEGTTIVVKKDIANAVLEERHPATRRNGKQAPTAVYTKAEVKAKVAAATKATATGMNTMASKHAVELENGFAKKTRFMKGKVAAAQKATVATKAAAKAAIKKVQEKSTTDTGKAIALNKELLETNEQQAVDLKKIEREKTDLNKFIAGDPELKAAVAKARVKLEARAPGTPAASSGAPRTPGTPAASTGAPRTPAQRGRSRSMAR